ncbi:hypothetical protein JKP88DRAFT_142203, partial [Tribonema minus]
LPFISWLGTEQLSRGTCHHAQQTIIEGVWRIPGLANNLLQGLNTCSPAIDEHAVAWFLDRVVHAAGEPGSEARSHEAMRAMARVLAEREDAAVRKLGESLLEATGQALPASSPGQNTTAAAAAVPRYGVGRSLEAARAAVAGGRHDNDHADFRSVRVEPTVAELSCEEPPYLPAPGEAPRLERQFRLLRHDLVASMREEIDALRA